MPEFNRGTTENHGVVLPNRRRAIITLRVAGVVCGIAQLLLGALDFFWHLRVAYGVERESRTLSTNVRPALCVPLLDTVACSLCHSVSNLQIRNGAGRKVDYQPRMHAAYPRGRDCCTIRDTLSCGYLSTSVVVPKQVIPRPASTHRAVLRPKQRN